MSAVFVVDTRYMRYTDSSFRLTVKRDSSFRLTVKRDSPHTLTVKRDAQTRTQLTTMTHREDE